MERNEKIMETQMDKSRFSKVVIWFKNLFNRNQGKKLLNEENPTNKSTKRNTNFVPKAKVNEQEAQNTRENIIMSMQKDILPEGLNETYEYSKFGEDYIINNYDQSNVLSKNDMQAISCLYGAIKEGNEEEFPHFSDNKIRKFIEEKQGNLVKLVDLMVEDGEKELENLPEDLIEIFGTKEAWQLIPGSYADVCKVIEEYREKEVQTKE